ncbi:hypothetical protein P7C73_g5268, partial [Tremellales sp. Uapishka_1]
MSARYTSKAPEDSVAYKALEAKVRGLEAELEAHKRNISSKWISPRPEHDDPAWSSPVAYRPEITRKISGSSSGSHDEDFIPSFGTLVLGNGGRSRYVGATGASEWLNETMGSSDLEAQSMGSASISPIRHMLGPSAMNNRLPRARSSSRSRPEFAFSPFRSSSDASYGWLRGQLPSKDEASALVGYYFRHYAWNYNIVIKSQFAVYFNAFYDGPPPTNQDQWTHETHPHKLALLYVVLAMGSLFNLEVESGKEPGKKYYEYCTECLALGDLLRQNTMASLQTLHIMINYLCYVDRIKGGDAAWILWGMVWRLVVAMGMHRDGKQWNLPAHILDERRRVFWEIYTEDTFQANCFGRPGGIAANHYDVEFPIELEPSKPGPGSEANVGYPIIKFRLARIANEVLDQVMTVKPPSYSSVINLWSKLAQFEKALPYFLRCQPAMLALVSVFPEQNDALAASPPVNREELKLTFQQHALALNISETILFLLRPFYARALHEQPLDPSKSKYGEAFLAVVERCRIIVSIVTSIHSVYPSLAYRHWFFAYHASSAAVCMASLVIVAPRSPLALLGWNHLQTVCDLFTSLAPGSESTTNSLTLLLRLRETAFSKLNGRWEFSEAQARLVDDIGSAPEKQEEAEEHPSLLMGLHTRLVDRMNQDVALSKVIKQNESGRKKGGDAKPIGQIQMSESYLAPYVYPAPQFDLRHSASDQMGGPPQQSYYNQQANVGRIAIAKRGGISPRDSQLFAPAPYPAPIEASSTTMDLDALPSESLNVLGQLWPRNDITDAPMNFDWSTPSQNVNWNTLAAAMGINVDPGEGNRHPRPG